MGLLRLPKSRWLHSARKSYAKPFRIVSDTETQTSRYMPCQSTDQQPQLSRQRPSAASIGPNPSTNAPSSGIRVELKRSTYITNTGPGKPSGVIKQTYIGRDGQEWVFHLSLHHAMSSLIVS